jgi:hypothetical protein
VSMNLLLEFVRAKNQQRKIRPGKRPGKADVSIISKAQRGAQLLKENQPTNVTDDPGQEAVMTKEEHEEWGVLRPESKLVRGCLPYLTRLLAGVPTNMIFDCQEHERIHTGSTEEYFRKPDLWQGPGCF